MRYMALSHAIVGLLSTNIVQTLLRHIKFNHAPRSYIRKLNSLIRKMGRSKEEVQGDEGGYIATVGRSPANNTY